jgi:hypothetical protein
LKTDVNVPTKRPVVRKKKKFCWHLEGHSRKEQDPEQNPKPQHCFFGSVLIFIRI